MLDKIVKSEVMKKQIRAVIITFSLKETKQQAQ